MPASAMPQVSKVVATGRRMKSAANLTVSFPSPALRPRFDAAAPAQQRLQPVKGKIDDRGREQRQQLADHKPADDGGTKRMAQLRAGAAVEHQRQRAEDRGQCRHQDGAETEQAGLVDRLARRLAIAPLCIEREVDHHDGVLLDDTDQQDDADDGHDVEILPGDHQRQQGADSRRRQGREDGDRVDEALIEHAQDDVDGEDRGGDQHELVVERILEGEGGPLEVGQDAGREGDLALGALDGVDRLAEGCAWREVEGDGHRRELADVIDLQRRRLLMDLSSPPTAAPRRWQMWPMAGRWRTATSRDF